MRRGGTKTCGIAESDRESDMSYRIVTFVLWIFPLFCTVSASAADPLVEWAASGGSATADKTRAVAFDREGNVFLAGETSGEGTFGDQHRDSLGSTDFFLAKVSRAGRFLWVRSLGGSQIDRGYGVVTDAAGNAYVTGHYQSTEAKADGEILPNRGDYDLFVARFSPEGHLDWIRTAGGTGYDYGHAIALAPDGDLVVSGAMVGEVKFGDVTVNPGSQIQSIFCAKYSPSGEVRWAKSTAGNFHGSGHGVGVDGKGAIYIGGSGGGSGTFGSLSISPAAVGQSAILIKLNQDGDALWFRSVAGNPSAGFHEITVDVEGRVWGAGMFRGELAAPDQVVSSTGEKDNDGFLASYATDGTLRWIRTIQSPGVDYCLGLTADGTGRCFVTGEFSGTASFGGKSLTSLGATDIYAAALDAEGQIEWLFTCGGVKGDNAYTMAWHPDGRLALAGAWTPPVTYGKSSLEAGNGGADAYGLVLKWK